MTNARTNARIQPVERGMQSTKRRTSTIFGWSYEFLFGIKQTSTKASEIRLWIQMAAATGGQFHLLCMATEGGWNWSLQWIGLREELQDPSCRILVEPLHWSLQFQMGTISYSGRACWWRWVRRVSGHFPSEHCNYGVYGMTLRRPQKEHPRCWSYAIRWLWCLSTAGKNPMFGGWITWKISMLSSRQSEAALEALIVEATELCGAWEIPKKRYLSIFKL